MIVNVTHADGQLTVRSAPQGPRGYTGPQGIQGIQGIQGPIGEVSQAELEAYAQPLDADLTTIATATPGGMFGYGTDAAGTKGFFRPALFESTGALYGFKLQINAGDNTRFDIVATAGGISYGAFTTYSPNPVQPIRSVLTFPDTFSLEVTNLLTHLETYVGIDGAGVVVQQTTPFTNEQTRTIIAAGVLIHSNQTNLNAVNPTVNQVRAGISQVYDFFRFHGPESKGLVYSPNGANLNLNREVGSVFKLGSNAHTNPLDPHVVSFLTSVVAGSFRYRTRFAEVSGDVSAVDPNNYDVAGVVTAVPANKFTIQHITMFTPTGLTRIQYGQTVYNSIDEAIAAHQTEAFVTESNIANNGVFRAWLIVRQGTTALNDVTRARVIASQNVSSTGSVAGGAPSSGGTWTPTALIVSNLDSITPRASSFVQVTGGIAFSATVTVDPTASGPIRFTLTPPIAVDFTSTYNASGTVVSSSSPPMLGRTIANIAANTLEIIAENAETAPYDLHISGVYHTP